MRKRIQMGLFSFKESRKHAELRMEHQRLLSERKRLQRERQARLDGLMQSLTESPKKK